MTARIRRSTLRTVAGLLALMLVAVACGDADTEEEETPDDAAEDEEETPDDDAAEDDSAAASGECDTLEPLDSGFPSEPITLLVVDEAGSADGIMARDVQRSLEEYVPVSINIVDRPDFGRFGNYEAAEWMSEQPGGSDGYIAGVIIEPGGTSDLIAEPVIEELGASFDTFNHVLAVEQTPYGLYTATDRPWGDSLEEFFTYGQENPGELRYLGGGGGSGRDIAVADYMERMDVEYEELTGGSFTEIAAAIAAGEADFAIVSTEIVQQFYEDGRIEVLGLTQDGDPVESLNNAPRLKEVTGQDVDPWGRTSGFFVTEETPDEHRAWLAEALSCVTQDADFIESREAIAGNTVVTMGHEEFREVAVEGYYAAFPILERAGLVAPTVEAPLER